MLFLLFLLLITDRKSFTMKKMSQENTNEIKNAMLSMHDEEFVAADLNDINEFRDWTLMHSNINSDEFDNRLKTMLTKIVG